MDKKLGYHRLRAAFLSNEAMKLCELKTGDREDIWPSWSPENNFTRSESRACSRSSRVPTEINCIYTETVIIFSRCMRFSKISKGHLSFWKRCHRGTKWYFCQRQNFTMRSKETWLEKRQISPIMKFYIQLKWKSYRKLGNN